VCACACCQVCSSFIPWDELKPLFWICLCWDPFVKKRATPFSCPFWHNYSRTIERPAGFTLLADVLLPLYVLEIDGHVLPLWMNVNTAISPRRLLPWWRGTQSWCHHTLSAACSCFSFFFSLLPLLSAFLFCCHRFQSNYLPSPFHKYLLHTHSYSSWVTRMQRFFLLIHFILLPLHIALVLSLAEESQVSYCSPLWLYRIVLTNKSKVKAHFAQYILSFSFSGAFMCICRLNYTTFTKLDQFACTVSSNFGTNGSQRIELLEQFGAKCFVGC